MGIAVKGETEAQFDARMSGYEKEIKENHPEVKWVNAEEYAKKMDKGFYGHILPSHFEKSAIIKTMGRFK